MLNKTSLLHTRKILCVLLLFCLTATFLIASGCSKDDASAPVKETEIIRLGLALQPQSGLLMVALHNKYFEDQGLAVEITEYPSGKRALHEGFFTGKVDLAMTSDVPLSMAALEGKEYRILASTFLADNVNRIIARKDAGIEKPTDLTGKRLATQRGSAVHFFQHHFLLEYGIPEEQIVQSFMKAEKLPKALLDGSIDAFTMREPFISQARELLGDNAVVFSAPGVYKQMELVIVTPEFLAKEKSSIRKFLKGLIMAEEYINNYPEESRALIAAKLNVSVESIESLWPEIKLQVSLGQSIVLSLEDIARWAIRHKIIDKDDVPNFVDIIYQEGLREIKPEVVTIF